MSYSTGYIRFRKLPQKYRYTGSVPYFFFLSKERIDRSKILHNLRRASNTTAPSAIDQAATSLLATRVSGFVLPGMSYPVHYSSAPSIGGSLGCRIANATKTDITNSEQLNLMTHFHLRLLGFGSRLGFTPPYFITGSNFGFPPNSPVPRARLRNVCLGGSSFQRNSSRGVKCP